jgi:hypothetical protein
MIDTDLLPVPMVGYVSSCLDDQMLSYAIILPLNGISNNGINILQNICFPSPANLADVQGSSEDASLLVHTIRYS